MAGRPDVLVLSGFLGSGKTTLLVQLVARLRGRFGEGYVIAIIENEIGAASVDTGIVQEAGYSVTEILSGCVCCTLAGQLIPAMRRLVDDLSPDLIILEATGVASPGPIRENLEQYIGCCARVVTLVDASRWEHLRVPLRALLEGQVAPADVVVVNKSDLASPEQLESVAHDIRTMNDSASVVVASASRGVFSGDLDAITGVGR